MIDNVGTVTFSLSVTFCVLLRKCFISVLLYFSEVSLCDYMLHMICSEKTFWFAGEEDESQALTYPFHDTEALLVIYIHIHRKHIAINHYYLICFP
jgi:hypothetical protein